MSQLNLIIGPAQLQEYDGEKEKEEERERKTRLLKALEDKFRVGGSTPQIIKYAFCLSHQPFFIHPESLLLSNEHYSLRVTQLRLCSRTIFSGVLTMIFNLRQREHWYHIVLIAAERVQMS